MAQRMRQPKGVQKLRSLAAYVPEKVYKDVDAIAQTNRWSISVAVGFLVEQGLLATRKGKDTLLGMADEGGRVELEVERRERKSK